MAITLATENDASIELDEFVADVESSLDSQDEATLIALAPRLGRLANNRRFLASHINEQLESWEYFQSDSPYTSQVLQLKQGHNFLVRANIWEPLGKTANSAHDDLFMYQQAHDHNFSFLTVGYLGAGYQTTIYECDPGSVTGIPGDRVDMTFLETTTLPLYRSQRDIHRQEHPREYSISLNLIALDPQQGLRTQHRFDLASQTLVGRMQAGPGQHRLTCQLAAFVGNDATRSLLDTIRQSNPLPQVRLAATESLAALSPGDATTIWSSALDDDHPLVRRAARGWLESDEPRSAQPA